jgi:RNA polymerase sigma-70 factor (ECF subfamily)
VVQIDPRTKPTAPDKGPSWIAGCSAGDSDAVAAMFAEHCATVERVISRLVGSTADLEDLVQNTFVEALRSLSRYRGEASFKTWITSIAVHIAQHHLRAGKIRRLSPLELVPETRIASPAPNLEALLDERRLSVRLHGLLDKIPARQRIALLLFTIDGRPVEEVAALMGASQTTTRSRVFFARRALRAKIAADPELAELAQSLMGAHKEGSA